MNEISKYPLEVEDVIQNRTYLLYVNALLTWPAKEGEMESPLKVFKPTDRFEFILTNKDKKQVSIGIVKPSEVPAFYKRAEYAFKKHLDSSLSDDLDQSGQDSPAYTVRLGSGRGIDGSPFKGRTPADILSGNPNDVASLQHQAEYLAQNLSRYPKNEVQINAIHDALTLFHRGQLQKSTAKTRCLCLLRKNLRPRLYCKETQERRDGRTLCYDMNAEWNIGSEYPVTFEISNYFTRCERRSDGTVNVRRAEAVDEKKFLINIDGDQFLNLIVEPIYSIVGCYKQAVFGRRIAEGNSLYVKAMSEAKRKREQERQMQPDPSYQTRQYGQEQAHYNQQAQAYQTRQAYR